MLTNNYGHIFINFNFQKLNVLSLRNLLLLLSLLSMHFVSAQDQVKQSFLNDLYPDKLEFLMYPNPYKNGALYFLSSPKKIKNIVILNILGEVVFQTSTYEDFVIPNILNSGIYIVKIKQGGK